jgi:hypothetical protein
MSRLSREVVWIAQAEAPEHRVAPLAQASHLTGPPAMTSRILLLTFLVLPASTGCLTLTGGVMGVTMTPGFPADPHAFDQIPIGSRVELSLIGGERVAGQVTGYADRGAPPASVPGPQPVLGDSVVVTEVSGREVPCVLHGFRRRALAVGCSEMSIEVPYDSVRRVSWGGGQSLDGDTMRELSDAGALPIWGTLRLATADGTRTIPLDRVVRVRSSARSRNMVLGMAVGLAADVLIGLLFWSQVEIFSP